MKHLQTHKIGYTYAFALTFLLFAIVLGLLLGATEIGLSDIFEAIFHKDTESPAGKIIRYVRFPRVMASLLCGAALAVSGAVIQAVFLNRLASPSMIGVNAGAGLAVTISTALGVVGGFRLSLFAFLGAFLAVIPVSLGAKKWGASRGTVVLIGVTLNALLGAVSDTITTLFPEVAVMHNDFRIGDFSFVTYAKLTPAALIVLVSTALLFTLSSELDVLTLGEENARGLGLNTGLMRLIFLLLATLLAGAAVSIAGLLSFVGLLVPHAVRRMASAKSRHLLPLCALIGAGFVTFCDTLSRTIAAPFELPVGILMAFLGAPFFLSILIRKKGGTDHD